MDTSSRPRGNARLAPMKAVLVLLGTVACAYNNVGTQCGSGLHAAAALKVGLHMDMQKAVGGDE